MQMLAHSNTTFGFHRLNFKSLGGLIKSKTKQHNTKQNKTKQKQQKNNRLLS